MKVSWSQSHMVFSNVFDNASRTHLKQQYIKASIKN